MNKINEPYVKQYDANGLVLNKITKQNPLVNPNPNRRQRRFNAGREMSNKKGISLVVTKIGNYKFEKTIKRRHPDGTVTYIEVNPKQKQSKKLNHE